MRVEAIGAESDLPFNRHRLPEERFGSEPKFLSVEPDSLVPSSALAKARHRTSELIKRKKRGDVGRYVLKHALDSLYEASLEVYSAWIFRLFISDGARIPKYSHYGSGSAVISKKIPGMKTLLELRSEHHWDEDRFVLDFVKRMRDPVHDNLRVFAQILVNSIVFAEDDLKDGHVVFDDEGRLTCIDFDHSFTPGLIFDAEEFESLPNVSIFSAYNFIFNQEDGEPVYSGIPGLIAYHLNPELKHCVYEAVLKILLMPDFLLREVETEIRPYASELISSGIELAPQKKEKLFLCMAESDGFKYFLRDCGEKSKARILAEINSFRTNNSHFRKKWSVDVFHDQCAESVERAYLKLRSAYRIDLISSLPSVDFSRSSPVSKDFPVGQKASSSKTVKQSPVLNLQRFVTAQIARLESYSFKSGADDKIELLKTILVRLSGVSPDSLPQLQSEVAIIMYQRRYKSLFFSHGGGAGWEAWKIYCRENHIDLRENPSVQMGSRLITSYETYRSYVREALDDSTDTLSDDSFHQGTSFIS